VFHPSLLQEEEANNVTSSVSAMVSDTSVLSFLQVYFFLIILYLSGYCIDGETDE